MEAKEFAETSKKKDFFAALNLEHRRYSLSERQVYIEIHPSNSGPLAKLSKPPVLLAQELVVNIMPDDSCAAGVRIEAEIDVNGIEVISPDISEADKGRIKHKIRTELLQSSLFPVILFQVEDISVQADMSSVLAKGLLTIHGRAAEKYIHFKKAGPAAYEGHIKIRQSEFGLTPLSALMGGLRSDDCVSIRCIVKVE